MKVILVDFAKHKNPIIKEGESDGKLVDQFYVRVKVDSAQPQLYHAADIYEDTPENRKMIREIAETYFRMKEEISTYMGKSLDQMRDKRAYVIAREKERKE